jgi:hypothetical protein
MSDIGNPWDEIADAPLLSPAYAPPQLLSKNLTEEDDTYSNWTDVILSTPALERDADWYLEELTRYFGSADATEFFLYRGLLYLQLGVGRGIDETDDWYDKDELLLSEIERFAKLALREVNDVTSWHEEDEAEERRRRVPITVVALMLLAGHAMVQPIMSDYMRNQEFPFARVQEKVFQTDISAVYLPSARRAGMDMELIHALRSGVQS